MGETVYEEERVRGAPAAAHAVAVSLGAFLLFFVQPMMGKFLLPWFGGGSGVWAVCLVFFQVGLFVGYVYAHALSLLPLRAQHVLHAVLLVIALLTLSVAPDPSWKPEVGAAPTWGVLRLLFVHVGLPYVLLAATAPLLQHWLARGRGESSPYWLYAVSNGAALLALVGYPFVVEPALGRLGQASFWSYGFGAFVLACCLSALGSRGKGVEVASESEASEGAIGVGPRALWIALPACSSALLVATTSQISTDVAPVPFLWVLPLATYLLSFVLCFRERAVHRRLALLVLWLPSVAAVSWLLAYGRELDFRLQMAVYVIALFVSCMFCHGELYRLRPPSSRLTSFYSALSLGGALGGIAVAVLAPVVLDSVVELPITLVLLGALMVWVFRRDGAPELEAKTARSASVTLAIALVGIAASFAVVENKRRDQAVLMNRNFYGTQVVYERDRDQPLWHQLELKSGTTTHGLQYQHEQLRLMPTAYFTPESGAGVAIRSFAAERSLHIGVIGLGVGTIAAYGKPGDRIQFYEIDPKVVRVANQKFSFLEESDGEVTVNVGDARLVLDAQSPQEFDVLVLDAFSGDAVPVHLLTVEGMRSYLRHLEPDGVIAAHISNLYLDLLPVVAANARELELSGAWLSLDNDREKRISASTWALLSPSEERLLEPSVYSATLPLTEEAGVRSVRTWTDDHSSLLDALR